MATTPHYEANQIMLDLETLATEPTAIVVAVGLVRFDPADLQDPIKDTHYAVLSVGDQEENERTVSEATINWWAEQSDEAKLVLTAAASAEHNVHEQLLRIAEWMGKNAVVWGNGSDFDNVILSSLFQTYELRQPWPFRNNRCFRTLCALGTRRMTPAKMKTLGMPYERQGVHHNALDDAVYQAQIATRMMRVL